MLETGNGNDMINLLPEDVLSYILPFINIKTLIFTNTEYYCKNHKLVKYMIPKLRYDAYIRNIIRSDNDYVLLFLLNENIDKWINMNKYPFKNYIFNNYLFFLNYLSIEYNSNNCRRLIENKTQGVLGKKWHKKVKIRNCKWSI